MNYLEWNNIISEYFFNPEQAGRDVYLYITKSDIIGLGRKNLNLNDDEVWEDYITSLKNGIDKNSFDSITGYAYYCYKQFRRLKYQDSYPLYIGYLVFFVLPLTDSGKGSYSVNSYYPRLNDFIKSNKIKSKKISVQNFKVLDELWQDLEEWSILIKNTELGIFELKKFGNPNWVHVGKPLSQCLFPPKAIKNLPVAFNKFGLIPNNLYSEVEIKNLIIRFGENLLGLRDSVISIIKDKKNELGKSIIDIVQKEYDKWTGESHLYEFENGHEKIIMNDTIVPLILQIKIKDNEEIIDFSEVQQKLTYLLNEFSKRSL